MNYELSRGELGFLDLPIDELSRWVAMRRRRWRWGVNPSRDVKECVNAAPGETPPSRLIARRARPGGPRTGVAKVPHQRHWRMTQPPAIRLGSYAIPAGASRGMPTSLPDPRTTAVASILHVPGA